MTAKKMFLRFIVTSIAFLLTACAIMEEQEPLADKGNNRRSIAGTPYTKSLSQEDSLQLVIAFQTDKRNMLLHQIKEDDGVFVLDMTDDDARNLSIPDSLYHWAQDIVRIANSKSNK